MSSHSVTPNRYVCFHTHRHVKINFQELFSSFFFALWCHCVGFTLSLFCINTLQYGCLIVLNNYIWLLKCLNKNKSSTLSTQDSWPKKTHFIGRNLMLGGIFFIINWQYRRQVTRTEKRMGGDMQQLVPSQIWNVDIAVYVVTIFLLQTTHLSKWKWE